MQRSPLLRTTDQLERAIGHLLVNLLIVVVLVAIPIGLTVGQHALQDGQGGARTQQAAAVLLSDAPMVPAAYAYPPIPDVLVSASWRTADGLDHVGQVTAPSGSPAGTEITLWVDSHGEKVATPMTPVGAAILGLMAGLSMILIIGGATATLWAAARRRIQSRNYDMWAQEWALVEPLWTSRRKS